MTESNVAAAVRYDRLVKMAEGAAEFEIRDWADRYPEYFVVMASIRDEPELWFGGATNGRVRAEQITKSIRREVRRLREGGK